MANFRPQKRVDKQKSDRRQQGQRCSKQDKKPPLGREQTKAKRGQENKQTLTFDPSERIDFVKGFGKRKQERRERAKQEALDQEREVRILLRRKRREALKRAQLGVADTMKASDGNEADLETIEDEVE